MGRILAGSNLMQRHGNVRDFSCNSAMFGLVVWWSLLIGISDEHFLTLQYISELSCSTCKNCSLGVLALSRSLGGEEKLFSDSTTNCFSDSTIYQFVLFMYDPYLSMIRMPLFNKGIIKPILFTIRNRVWTKAWQPYSACFETFRKDDNHRTRIGSLVALDAI